MSSMSRWVDERLLCAALYSYLCNEEIFFHRAKTATSLSWNPPTLSEALPHSPVRRKTRNLGGLTSLTNPLVGWDDAGWTPTHTHPHLCTHPHPVLAGFTWLAGPGASGTLDDEQDEEAPVLAPPIKNSSSWHVKNQSLILFLWVLVFLDMNGGPDWFHSAVLDSTLTMCLLSDAPF